MIINFDNLGGGGGGGYTLPTATDTRLGGVKIGSGVTVDSAGTISVSGSEDTNAQHRYTAATEAAMNALTGVSEGDVCTVAEHFGDMPQIFYDYMDWGNSLYSAIYVCKQDYGVSNIRFTLAKSPYYDGQTISTLDGYLIYYTSEGTSKYYGFGSDAVDGWYDLDGSTDVNNKTSMSEGDYFDLDLSQDKNLYGEMNSQYLIIRTAVTTYEYGMRAEVKVPETTYQYNNGEWVKLAPLSLASGAMSKANEAFNMAANKVDKQDPWYSNWSEIEYWSTFIGEVHVDNVSQGYRIHTPYAATERQNPKVTELVTSPSVGYIVALTQAQYDALVSGGTVDSQTLYAIIPSNS